MSTEHQQYSTENQRQVISEYARSRDMSIVRTYTDAGKSGLRIDGRDADISLDRRGPSLGLARFDSAIIWGIRT
jgi:Resolvase, N terminal domain